MSAPETSAWYVPDTQPGIRFFLAAWVPEWSEVAERVVKGREALATAAEEERATARGLAPFAARELLAC